ncbi:crotonobetainyl-CoA:carnitine CoA-transferase CaiB-like acyl-CoA transferase [Paraburkholderia unamae]|uniref:CaiB/BaiF CoA transferase family protein n=1 Tax=Paraburkholderia unamae TaxID=219649 RepID=UPI000DC56CA2|nr:CaiB/BaiF CoA-transferase family protein [Paraburkholderia unamae]RAR56708.1 crotonobetainyl-CoA:carnitine CoA-transferase CaiB-like acyl-CoA transferase [Paraburkholderia unamae]
MRNQTGGALAGLKVIDLSRVLAGPACAQTLADHGADVIKVEAPAGDDTRLWGPPFRDGAASYYMGVNRNKRGICLDLTLPRAREILFELLADADVLLENFKTGTMERWGLGYREVLAERFPRLIHCRISGFGETGPMGGMPGYDAVVQAMSGLMSINGDPASGATRIGVPIVDLATGQASVNGILLALLERARSGLGQSIDIALYDVALTLLHPPAANWFLSGKPQPLLGNGHPNIVPYDKFATASVDVFVGVGNDRQFAAFVCAIGLPELARDERYRTNPARIDNRAALRALIDARLRECEGEALCRELTLAGVPAGPVRDVGAALEDAHTQHREMRVAIDGYEGVGIPAKLSRTPGAVHRRPPRFAEHTREVLHELGYTDERIEALAREGVVRAAGEGVCA